MSFAKCAKNCGNINMSQPCLLGLKKFPADCPTCNDKDSIDKTLSMYKEDKDIQRIYQAAAKVESRGYCRWTRVQEALEFSKYYNARKIGIASCVGLMGETALMVKLFEKRGFEVLSACCKIGSFDKSEAGIAEQDKIRPGKFEAICNPIAQAQLCNKNETDLNFIMGLCIGHDSLFIKHSKAPVSYIVVKDRVTGHNPAAVFLTASTYYRKLFEEG